MLRLQAIVLGLFVSSSAFAQSSPDQASEKSVRDLADIIRKASRNELYLIDQVAQTCKRITSGLKQRDTIYFKTSENTESSELFLDGAGTLRFNAKGSAAVDCGIIGEVSFQLVESDENTWKANYASGYCMSALIYDNCAYSCNEYAGIDGRILIFANGQTAAETLSSSIGGSACIE